MTPIRPLEPDDLPAIARLYADFDGWDDDRALPALAGFFNRVLTQQPFADPEIPTLVYEDGRDGVVGVIGSHVRPFLYGERTVRVACSGPLIVAPAHRPRGIGALLMRRFIAGPQDMSVSDRTIDSVHAMWERLGVVTDTTASIGWARVLAPAGLAAAGLARRAGRRGRPPGAALLARVDGRAGRRLRPQPASGTIEPLSNQALLELMPDLRSRFDLLPAYDDAYLSWLFAAMEVVNVGERLVRRLVRADDGRPAGAYVMYLTPHSQAQVMQVAASGEDVGLVLDHLLQDAAAQGAVEVQGRFEAHLLPYLRSRWCRLVPAEWSTVQAREPALVGAVLSGRALLTRMDGEWWMRPHPGAA